MGRTKRSLKVKVIRFFQDELVQDTLRWLLFFGMIALFSYLPDIKL